MEDRLPSGNLPVVTRSINGRRYAVTRMGWWDALDAIALLEAVLGPSLAEAARALKVEGGSPDIEWGDLLAALPGAIGRAARRDGPGRELLKLLGERTSVEVEGRHVVLDYAAAGVWFAQHPEDVADWITLALEVEVWDFFARPVARLGLRFASAQAAQGEMPPGSRSQNT